MHDIPKLGGQNKFASAIDLLQSNMRRTVNQSTYGTKTSITTRGTTIVPISRFQPEEVASTPGSGSTFSVCRWA